MTVISFCGAFLYYLWEIKAQETTIFWANEMFQLELNLRKANNLSKPSEAQSDAPLDTFILIGFKLFLWTGYLLTPLVSVLLMVEGLDPQFYIVEYSRTAYPFIFVLLRAVTLNNSVFLHIFILLFSHY
ncbi:hypothetical protein Fcan01_26893 [Folsomia candida]|uniref:Uncharacterized protein n=1 Tax=Folsomia candida TaxID=158441 RepID=A0A226CZV3_FOLCA|nr:hypothetical protein Fcan01_26893 [Folsomia candida]